ncbi:DUF3443 domain-containing protein [Paraburkholderia hayleyella]|uniref:DUF3443 domain-containing protein n=1 Tax=Paraburkholderia hayleyella TaxID=2152889 RepID=UPI0012923A2C|nr:DUF3443 domain-containing protein [Paraburkholderia hayleyella]
MSAKRALLLFVCATLAACGGGGGGGDGGSGNNVPPVTQQPNPPTPPSSNLTSNEDPATTSPLPVTQSNIPNVQPISVTTMPGLVRNMLTTSVTLCVPGTSECATIDNIQVDTGSQGLRILNSALPASLQALPSIASGSGTSGQCAVFGSGYTWGAVRSADIRLAGHIAPGASIQIIADPTVPTVPTDCANAGLSMQTASNLRANGILGVGLFTADCGINCTVSPMPRWYYSCNAAGNCTPSTQPLAQQVTNPVSLFSADNNGVVIDLPAITDGGTPSVSGSMIFGIGTQANNGLGNAKVFKANQQSGYIRTAMDGNVYNSFLDSGSNGLFFPNPALPRCGLWYCPPDTSDLSATISGSDGTNSSLTFSVSNAQTLFSTSNYAFSDLAGPSANSVNWGLPFFYGRRIFTAIETASTPAGAGPYFAF